MMEITTELKTFNKLFADYQQRFIHFAGTYVQDQDAAEDFVLEALMYYWENRKRLPEDINIPAYVLTIVKHKCLNHLRHQQVCQEASEELSALYSWEFSTRLDTLEAFEPNQLFTRDVQEIVDHTLSALPEQTHRIFIMSRYENKSHKQIAEELAITMKGVEFHISKATKALRISLQDYLPLFLPFFYYY